MNPFFNRLPLENVENRDKFKASVQCIIRNGHGIIVLLHNDGRGAGFGAYATDLMLREEGESRSSEESYTQMGLGYDLRDYGAAVLLVKHHAGPRPIAFISSSAESLAKKPETVTALHQHGVQVAEWIFLS